MHVFNYPSVDGQNIISGPEIFTKDKGLFPRTGSSQAKELHSWDYCPKELIKKVLINESETN